MAWIESHQAVGTHPKMKKLARLLGIEWPTAVGHLHYLWWWALDFAQDGDLSKYDAYDIKEAMLWEGDENELLDALIKTEFIDITDKGLHLHDWTEYAGKLIERRAKDRARKRDAADAAKRSAEEFRGSSNGNPTESDGNLKDSFVTNQPTNQPKPTNPNQPKPTNLNQPTTPTSDALTLQERRFAEFWKAYPKKVGKAGCLKAWKKLKPTAELFNQIMATLEKQKKTEQWTREGGRFIPNPLTWLNQGRWDDEPTEVGGAPAPAQSGTLATLRRMYEEEGGDDE